MIERGVRFVQVWSGQGGPTGNWDNHANIEKELPPMTAATDKPIAGLLKDLKSRGLLEDTLVVWSTEFGRMPFSQGSTGRDHNGGTFVSWLAGAGIKPGVAHGESDEWSWKATLGRAYCYDLHATILHLLGIDHEKLTFRHNGAKPPPDRRAWRGDWQSPGVTHGPRLSVMGPVRDPPGATPTLTSIGQTRTHDSQDWYRAPLAANDTRKIAAASPCSNRRRRSRGEDN